MAVYKRQYQPYEGETTAHWQRVMVLPRYAYRRVFQSRFFLIFFVICFVVPVGSSILIYLRHNLSALELLNIPADALLAIDATFFRYLLRIQAVFAFLLTVFVGPGLISPDLANNGLALYLSRPFSRADYVLGKMSILMILQSAVTWIPLTALFFLQGSLAGVEWMVDNGRILLAILVGSIAWMVLLSLLALAISAWVRWRPVAGALMFGVFIVGQGFGAILKEVLVTRWAGLFQINYLFQIIWGQLFGDAMEGTFRIHGRTLADVPVTGAWITVVFLCLICLLLLSRRIRAYEVVR